MSKAGLNEVLAVLCRRPVGSSLTVGEICIALDPEAPNHYRAPLWRAVHKSLGILRARALLVVAQRPVPAVPPQPADYAATMEGRAVCEQAKPITGGARAKGKPQVRVNSFHDRLWTALRVKRRGTLPGLLQAASRDDDLNPIARGRDYLNSLERAGIVIAQGKRNLRVRAHGDNGARLITYILSKDLGPKTPAPQRLYVLDQNDGSHIPYEENSGG